MANNCVPPDGFWRVNRQVAERVWHRGDGATVSTRIAEQLSVATGIPVRPAKTLAHGALSTAVAAGIYSTFDSPFFALLAGVGLFAYLEQDRC